LPPLEAGGDLGAPGVPAGPVVEIACDESGFSGTNLLDAATPVFTHASVDLSGDEAAGLVDALRCGFPWPRAEFKSGQLLRGPRARESLESLLAALTGRAHVHVVDKEYFLVTRVVDLFVAEPTYAAGTRLTHDLRPAALTLYRAGRCGGRDWDAFLAAFVDLVRTKKRREPGRRVLERFVHTRDVLATGLDAEAQVVLDALTRSRVRAVLSRLAQDDAAIPPPLEPMLPALAETVLFWSGGRRQVLVVHDEQSALTATRLRRLQHVLSQGAGAVGGPGGRVSPLAGLVTVDSRDDPRVQVADILAGIARRSPDLDSDPLLLPFLSPTSLRDPAGRPPNRPRP
jgi:hypothetical protein